MEARRRRRVRVAGGELIDHCLRSALRQLGPLNVSGERGLLHLLDLHRRAECLGLWVLATGWQPQPQQCRAEVAGIPGLASATGDRYALAGLRRLLEDRAQRARDHTDLTTG